MGFMKIYNVMTLLDVKKNDQVLFVEEGFSFSAFCLQGLWLLYYKVWTLAVVIIIFQSCLYSLHKIEKINDTLFYGFGFSVAFFVALFAKTWHIESLKKNGYKFTTVIAAKNLDEAKLRFYQIFGEFLSDIRQE